MCTLGGDDGAILPAAVLLKLQQPRSTLDNSLLPLLHPHDSHRYCATKRGLGDELNLWNQLIHAYREIRENTSLGKNPQTNKAVIFSYFSITTVSCFADLKIYASASNCKDLIFWPYMSLAPYEATSFCEICCKSLDPIVRILYLSFLFCYTFN
jgi:hypothetical protein